LAVNNFVATNNQWKSWFTARIMFQQKFQKKLHHLNRNSQLRSVKNDPIGFSESESDKKIRLRILELLGIRVHSKTSDSLWLRHRLGNSDCLCAFSNF